MTTTDAVKPTTTAPAAAAKPAVAAKPATAAAPKPKAEPKPPRFALTSKIKLLPVAGENKEGKKYGATNDDKTVNPKRANTKSFTWFANYKDGMTIAELQEAYKTTGGSMNANLDWDIKHKFVEVVPVDSAK